MDGERTYMKFEKVVIKNFRNFDNVELDLSNKNIFFGLNDVGKTNFLYALRYVFDKDIRKQNLLDSDFHNKQLDKPIEIVVTIDISDVADSDCQKLRAQLKGALLSEHNKVYIKLFAEYSKTEMLALPILSWGGDINHLYEMKQRGYLYEIDYVFNVIYIDSYVDLYSLFKKNVSQLVRNEKDEDKDILAKIQNTVDDLNGHIASLSGIKEFEDKLTPEYQKFHDEGISVSIKSEIAVKGLYSNIIPYIKQDNDDNLYPTAGEGRKKLLAYSIYDILSDENAEKKINLFLIEEPENHLHKSMQIALSQILFTDSKYTYLFVTTHSPFVLYEMDNVNLVRIYSERKINSISTFYKVPDAYEKNRKMLNRCLSEAIFANKVLLVEGPSEYMLFSKVLSVVHPFYEVDGIYILPVDGVGFETYFSILDELEIFNVVKTDNDLRAVTGKGTYSVLGFSRCNNYIGEKRLPTKQIQENSVSAKRSLYNSNINTLDKIRSDFHIFLSKVDLENDLDEFLHDRLSALLDNDNPVKYLQDAKHYHMVELIEKLSDTAWLYTAIAKYLIIEKYSASIMPATAFAAGDIGTISFSHTYDSNGNAMRYNSSANIGGYTAGGTGNYKYRMFVDGENAFCIQPGVPLKTGNTLKKASSDTWNALSANQKKAVGLALLYGYQGNRNNLSGSDDEKWLATQTLVWEFVTGCREATGSYNQTSTTVYSLHFGSNYANSGARAVYDQIVAMLREHNTIPSFMSGGKNDITKELAYKDGKYSITLTDSNGVLSDYSFSSSDSNVSLSKSGNKLTISSRIKLRTLLKQYGYKRRSQLLLQHINRCMLFYHLGATLRGGVPCSIEDADLDQMLTFRVV